VTYEEIWSELETSSPESPDGYLIRRIRPDSTYDLYLAVEKPSNRRMLLLRFRTIHEPPPGQVPSTRGIEVRWQPPRAEEKGTTLQLSLLDRRFAGMFSQLVTDLVDVAALERSEVAAASLCIQRLERWQRFLQRAGNDGLGREAQQGLYGELWFLRDRLLQLVPASVAVLAWRGPTGAAQDFQLHGTAIEVKTTAATEPLSLLISNERQLDDSGLRALLLVAVALDVHEGTGESLNRIVNALRTLLLQSDSATQDTFEELLLEVGYLESQNFHYETTGYSIRQTYLFHVQDGFPRILGANLISGVGDVRYSVALSACRPFFVPGDTLINFLATEHDDGR
jgi:hypothetical protein